MSNRIKIILLAVLIPILVVLVLIGTHVICVFHEWIPATCTAPEICQYCDATQGEALGHKWEAATCETAKTCTVCAEVEGSPLGHDWLEATCLKAKECQTCSKTEGEPTGHQWKEATCTEPKTCSVCEETEGEALGHMEGEFENGAYYDLTSNKPYYALEKNCTVCGTRMSTRVQFLETFINEGKFVLTPEQFMTRVNKALSTLENITLTAGIGKLEDRTMRGVSWNSSGAAVALVAFTDTEDKLIEKQDATNVKIVGAYQCTDVKTAAAILIGMVTASKPDITKDEIMLVCNAILDANERGEAYEYGGIDYAYVATETYGIVLMVK